MTTDRRLAGTSAIAAVIALSGCGSSTPSSSTTGSSTTGSTTTAATAAAKPAGWGTLRLPSGATMPYPLGWRRIEGDKGTASAALFNSDGTVRAYLNVTPAIATETLTDWTHFRIAHNGEEGDRNVRLLSSQTNVAMDGGRASCVTDQYTTTRTAYRELACIVAPSGRARRVVLVAAAQPAAWRAEHHVLQYAIDHFSS